MVTGADSLDDMALLRHAATGKVCDRPYAVVSRFLAGLADRTPTVARTDGRVLVNIDDTSIRTGEGA